MVLILKTLWSKNDEPRNLRSECTAQWTNAQCATPCLTCQEYAPLKSQRAENVQLLSFEECVQHKFRCAKNVHRIFQELHIFSESSDWCNSMAACSALGAPRKTRSTIVHCQFSKRPLHDSPLITLLQGVSNSEE